jgi:hypothetical protein
LDWESYKELIDDFDSVLAYGKEVSASTVGMVADTDQKRYGEKIFVKLLAHCMTIRTLAPDPNRAKANELWDLSSLSAVARSAVETHDSFMHITQTGVTAEESEFRILLWELHDHTRRAKMLAAIGSSSPDYFEVVSKEQKLYERTLQHPFFLSIRGTYQKKIKDRDPPAFYFSQRDRCVVFRVDPDYYNAVTMQLSQYVHTFPFSLHQLFNFKAGTPDALHLMALPIRYSLAFLLRTIEGMMALFPGVASSPSPQVQTLMDVWSAILERGIKHVD